MKSIWKLIARIFIAIWAILSVGIMIFAIVSVTVLDQKDRTIFGYRLFIVTSDSMRATDFAAGDLILVKNVNVADLCVGDIISFTSTQAETYGQTNTHKIREILINQDGNHGFITYGTTTGVTDEGIVTENHVLGKYITRIPQTGQFFRFLKTVPGYILFVLLPFSGITIYYGVRAAYQFRNLKKRAG